MLRRFPFKGRRLFRTPLPCTHRRKCVKGTFIRSVRDESLAPPNVGRSDTLEAVSAVRAFLYLTFPSCLRK